MLEHATVWLYIATNAYPWTCALVNKGVKRQLLAGIMPMSTSGKASTVCNPKDYSEAPNSLRHHARNATQNTWPGTWDTRDYFCNRPCVSGLLAYLGFNQRVARSREPGGSRAVEAWSQKHFDRMMLHQAELRQQCANTTVMLPVTAVSWTCSQCGNSCITRLNFAQNQQQRVTAERRIDGYHYWLGLSLFHLWAR